MWRARNRKVRWLIQRFPDGPQSGSHHHYVSTRLPAITRAMDHLLFVYQQPIAGKALSIMGFEVDSEEAFEREIERFAEAFVEILKDELAFLLDHLKEVEGIVTKLAESGLPDLIAGAIAVAVVLAIDVFVALWGPADPIIEDAIGPTTLDLVQRQLPAALAQRAYHSSGHQGEGDSAR